MDWISYKEWCALKEFYHKQECLLATFGYNEITEEERRQFELEYSKKCKVL